MVDIGLKLSIVEQGLLNVYIDFRKIMNKHVAERDCSKRRLFTAKTEKQCVITKIVSRFSRKDAPRVIKGIQFNTDENGQGVYRIDLTAVDNSGVVSFDVSAMYLLPKNNDGKGLMGIANVSLDLMLDQEDSLALEQIYKTSVRLIYQTMEQSQEYLRKELIRKLDLGKYLIEMMLEPLEILLE